MSLSVYDFLKRFWAWSLSILALVGGYLALDQADVGWVIFVVAGVAILLALIRPAGEAFAKLRRYPSLVRQVGEGDEQLQASVAEASALRAEATQRFAEGVAEGRREVMGAYLASRAADAPRLAAVAQGDSGLTLTGRIPEGARVAVGARYNLEVEATGEKKGVVEVVLVDTEAQLAHMECVGRDIPQFWEALERRAAAEPEPPAGLRLTAVEFAIPTLALEAGQTDFEI